MVASLQKISVLPPLPMPPPHLRFPQGGEPVSPHMGRNTEGRTPLPACSLGPSLSGRALVSRSKNFGSG